MIWNLVKCRMTKQRYTFIFVVIQLCRRFFIDNKDNDFLLLMKKSKMNWEVSENYA